MLVAKIPNISKSAPPADASELLRHRAEMKVYEAKVRLAEIDVERANALADLAMCKHDLARLRYPVEAR